MLSEKVDGSIKDTNSVVEEMRGKIEKLSEERDRAGEVIENLRKETLAAKQEIQKKVNEMTQVTNMKKMIQDKNAKITQLRERLSKYEVDDSEEV